MTAKSTISSYSVQKASDYDIVNCWILDSGSNIHVGNDPGRFKTTHSTTSADYLISGSTRYPIQAYGKVDITFTSPAGIGKIITLNQVALVPGFFTNLVSFARAQAANIYWDTKQDTLFTKNKATQSHFCKLRRHNGHWIVEYNAPPSPSDILASSAATNTHSELPVTPPSSTEIASRPAPQRKAFEASPSPLHQILGHAGPDAIAKLPSAIDGLKLTSLCVQDEFRTCEAYRLSRARQIISRKTDNEIPATRLLQRGAYDLIAMEPGHNVYAWIS